MLIEDRDRHQLLDGRGRRWILGFGSDRLDRLKDAGVFYAGKIVEDFGFLAQCGVSSHGLAGDRNGSGGPQVLRKNKLEQAAFQAQQSNLRVLNLEHLSQYHADVERRDALAQHRSQGKQVLRENEFFNGPVFRLMGHKNTRKKINLEPLQVSHFKRQTGPVVTSYNPFGFSKVANDHDLSRQALRAQPAR